MKPNNFLNKNESTFNNMHFAAELFCIYNCSKHIIHVVEHISVPVFDSSAPMLSIGVLLLYPLKKVKKINISTLAWALLFTFISLKLIKSFHFDESFLWETRTYLSIGFEIFVGVMHHPVRKIKIFLECIKRLTN